VLYFLVLCHHTYLYLRASMQKKRRSRMCCGVPYLLFDYHRMIYVSVMFWTCWPFSFGNKWRLWESHIWQYGPMLFPQRTIFFKIVSLTFLIYYIIKTMSKVTGVGTTSILRGSKILH
jgi:hypothetical protein